MKEKKTKHNDTMIEYIRGELAELQQRILRLQASCAVRATKTNPQNWPPTMW